MKEIRSRWTVLALWLMMISAFWLIGEAVGWKRGKSPMEFRVWLGTIGLAGALAWALNGRKKL